MAYPERGREARQELSAFTTTEVERRRDLADAGRREDLPEGLLTHLAVDAYSDDGERMPLRELVNMVNQLLIAGHETTTSLITNCVWRLLEDRPARWCRLLAEPDLVVNAVEESLRFDAPVLGLCRTSDLDTGIDGVDIPAGSKLMVLYVSANRDPSRFPDRPDEFVLDRPVLETRRHYSFSWGIHHCLGAHLARLTPGGHRGAAGPAPDAAARRGDRTGRLAVPVGPARRPGRLVLGQACVQHDGA